MLPTGRGADAAIISFSLGSGTFVTLPAVGSQATDYTGVYQSPTFNVSTTINPGQSATFDLVFNDGGLRISDSSPVSLPNEGIIFSAIGSGLALVNPVIRVLNATGSYRVDATTDTNVSNATLDDYLGAGEVYNNGIRTGFFSGAFPNDPSRFAGVGLDLTQFSILFLGVEFEIFNAGPNAISISQLSFLAVGNTVEAVPAPAALPLLCLGLGLIGVALVTRRRRIA
jgi:hypothetical protein